jgi:hypothetical protein
LTTISKSEQEPNDKAANEVDEESRERKGSSNVPVHVITDGISRGTPEKATETY